jgi:hypothetical protein
MSSMSFICYKWYSWFNSSFSVAMILPHDIVQNLAVPALCSYRLVPKSRYPALSIPISSPGDVAVMCRNIKVE